jgi:hypothetical protein
MSTHGLLCPSRAVCLHTDCCARVEWYVYTRTVILAYWCIIDCRVTLFQHTDVLLILMVPHSTILMCYWFSCNLIPAYWCVIDSHGTAFQHTDVLTILVWPYSSILKDSWFSGDLKYCWLRWPHSSILMCYWFSWYLIPPYSCVIDSHETSFLHTDVLLILMVLHSSILMC